MRLVLHLHDEHLAAVHQQQVELILDAGVAARDVPVDEVEAHPAQHRVGPEVYPDGVRPSDGRVVPRSVIPRWTMLFRA